MYFSKFGSNYKHHGVNFLKLAQNQKILTGTIRKNNGEKIVGRQSENLTLTGLFFSVHFHKRIKVEFLFYVSCTILANDPDKLIWLDPHVLDEKPRWPSTFLKNMAEINTATDDYNNSESHGKPQGITTCNWFHFITSSGGLSIWKSYSISNFHFRFWTKDNKVYCRMSRISQEIHPRKWQLEEISRFFTLFGPSWKNSFKKIFYSLKKMFVRVRMCKNIKRMRSVTSDLKDYSFYDLESLQLVTMIFFSVSMDYNQSVEVWFIYLL